MILLFIPNKVCQLTNVTLEFLIILLSIELIAIIVVGCVVFLLILVGIVDKLTCPQKSGDDIEDGDEDDSKA